MIQEVRKTKKEYVCISFYLDRNSTRPGVFLVGDASLDRLKNDLGITDLKKYKNKDGDLLMGNIFDIINDAVNAPGAMLVGVSEDAESMRYHFVIE